MSEDIEVKIHKKNIGTHGEYTITQVSDNIILRHSRLFSYEYTKGDLLHSMTKDTFKVHNVYFYGDGLMRDITLMFGANVLDNMLRISYWGNYKTIKLSNINKGFGISRKEYP